MALLCLAALCWLGPTGNQQSRFRFFYTTLVSTLFCLLWHWPRLPVFTESGFYPGDSLYTLGAVKAIALAGLTSVLLLCACYVSWKVTRAILKRTNTKLAVSVLAALLNGALVILLYRVFLSGVPQLYYLIYLQIFPDLPTQWVIKGLIPAEDFLSVLFFTDQASLSSHAAGLLGWVLFVNAIIQWSGGLRPRISRSQDL